MPLFPKLAIFGTRFCLTGKVVVRHFKSLCGSRLHVLDFQLFVCEHILLYGFITCSLSTRIIDDWIAESAPLSLKTKGPYTYSAVCARSESTKPQTSGGQSRPVTHAAATSSAKTATASRFFASQDPSHHCRRIHFYRCSIHFTISTDTRPLQLTLDSNLPTAGTSGQSSSNSVHFVPGSLIVFLCGPPWTLFQT